MLGVLFIYFYFYFLKDKCIIFENGLSLFNFKYLLINFFAFLNLVLVLIFHPILLTPFIRVVQKTLL
jgi:hypothetical protein